MSSLSMKYTETAQISKQTASAENLIEIQAACSPVFTYGATE